MPLKTEWIGNFNPFNWLTCPTCGKSDFTSLSGASVWCDACNTKFTVRHTAGDPGCVVDATTEAAYGPTFVCETCTFVTASLEQTVECPTCKAPMARRKGYSRALMENPPRQWYMVLKIGDYCSGWLLAGDKVDIETMHSHPSCKDKCLQETWNTFQGQADFCIDRHSLPDIAGR